MLVGPRRRLAAAAAAVVAAGCGAGTTAGSAPDTAATTVHDEAADSGSAIFRDGGSTRYLCVSKHDATAGVNGADPGLVKVTNVSDVRLAFQVTVRLFSDGSLLGSASTETYGMDPGRSADVNVGRISFRPGAAASGGVCELSIEPLRTGAGS